jgi:SP family general alpha glucoside:H+ symporter-like MFS transporter
MGVGSKALSVGLTEAQLQADTGVDPELVRLGYAVIERQKQETFREAWRNHWRAACWSIFLTSALFMEGYDTAVVRGWVWPR